jgi:hypothetical protein
MVSHEELREHQSPSFIHHFTLPPYLMLKALSILISNGAMSPWLAHDFHMQARQDIRDEEVNTSLSEYSKKILIRKVGELIGVENPRSIYTERIKQEQRELARLYYLGFTHKYLDAFTRHNVTGSHTYSAESLVPLKRELDRKGEKEKALKALMSSRIETVLPHTANRFGDYRDVLRNHSTWRNREYDAKGIKRDNIKNMGKAIAGLKRHPTIKMLKQYMEEAKDERMMRDSAIKVPKDTIIT